MNVELSVIAYPQVNPMSYHILCVDSDTRRFTFSAIVPGNCVQNLTCTCKINVISFNYFYRML